MRWSSLRWPMTGSIAARRLKSRLICSVTRRFWPAVSADIVVRNRGPVRGHYRPSAIEVIFEDRVDRAVGARADLERPAAGGFKSFMPIALGEPDDADAGAEALLRCARSRRMISTNAAVWWPIAPACRRRRSGVQSA